MANMLVVTASSLWKTCTRALFHLYRRKGPLGKFLLPLTLILLVLYGIRVIVLPDFIYWISIVASVYIGWKWANFIRKFPAFTMVVLYIGLLSYFVLYSIQKSETIIAHYMDFIIMFFGSALVGTIRTFLREKNPHSPFLIVRIRNAFPKHIRAIGDSIGILVITALILLAVFYWEEVPKCIYNVAERKFTNVYDRIDKNSRDIDSLIERKKSETISVEDFDLFTNTYMDLFVLQNQYLREADQIVSVQSKIPFLPSDYQVYHHEKIKWLQAHQAWLTSFHELKRLENVISDVYFEVENIKDHMLSALQGDPTKVDSGLRQVIKESQEIRKKVDALKKQNQISEEMEDYVAIRTKQIIDMSEIVLSSFQDTKPDIDYYATISEIQSRGNSLDALAIYGRWREGYSAPMEQKVYELYDTAYSFEESMFEQFFKNGILKDRISPFVEKIGILPVYEQVKDTPPLPLTKRELEEYYRIYQDPYVMHIRNSLNEYLKLGKETSGIEKVAVEKATKDDLEYGLQSFNREYYKSKFVVIETYIQSDILKVITIVFQNKPDRYFITAVRATGNQSYTLENFFSPKSFSTDDTKSMYERYGELILDTKHSL